LTTLATAVSESETIEEVYEPFDSGRIYHENTSGEVTDKAYKHLGKLNTNIQGGLF
jgi:Holliday junction DNA helicase RuvB